MFYHLLPISALSLFLFCNHANAQSSFPSISEEEASKYEIEYLKEYEELKKTSSEPSFKWIQPKNKKETCKVYVSFNPKDDYTLKEGYSLYWDGDCKDGYAYGLGREMEYRDYSYHYQIGIYKNGMAEDYCVNINEAEGVTQEGECHYSSNQADHKVVTIIKNKEADLSIEYRYGAFYDLIPSLLTYKSPFSDHIKYIKAYPNFTYLILDKSQDEFHWNKYAFTILDKNQIQNGFEFDLRKDEGRIGSEIINGKLHRRVTLPSSYEDKMNNILLEVKEAANKAITSQEKAKIIKNKYKMKICKDKIKVTFMDNDEYKSICEEDKKFEQLRVKINEKIDRLNLAKQQKRQQLNEDKILKAQQNTANKTEALARQRAAIAEEALEEQRRANLNQGFQNLNQTLQLQQLNRNMSWDALTPKRFDVYMH